MTLNISNKLILNAVEDSEGVSKYNNAYELPVASTTTLGGVKIDGDTIVINEDGVISATVSAPSEDEEEAAEVEKNWVWVNRDIAMGRELNTNYRKIQIDVTEYLPDDDNEYNLMFSVLSYCVGDWLTNIQLYISSDAADEYESDKGTFICAGTKTLNNDNVKEYCGGQVIFPVGADRTIYIENKGTGTAYIDAFKLVGYKIIGV